MFYSTDSLRQEALVNDEFLTLLPCKQNGGTSNEIEQNWVCTLANLCMPLQALQHKYSPKVWPEIYEWRAKKGSSGELFLWSDEALYEHTILYIIIIYVINFDT